MIMGTDIHTHVEVLGTDGKWHLEAGDPFAWRNYGMFGFLANVRNYSRVPVISEARGIPEDACDEIRRESEWVDAHSRSWLGLRELLEYDYDREFWDQRVMRNGNGAARAEPGEGRTLTIREFLGEGFFDDLARLEAVADRDRVRVVFWFDN